MKDRLEIRLDRPQMVWLTLGSVVAMGLMFALGVVVGRRAARIEPAVPTQNTLASIEEEKAIHEQFTFYEKLTGEQKRRHPEPSARVELGPVPIEAVMADAEPDPRPKAEPEPEPRPKPKPKPQPAADSDADLKAAVARVRTKAATPASEARDDIAITAGLSRGPASSGEYTVQVSAFQTRAEADAYASGLSRQGFAPFIIETSLPGKGTWYRVRMGRFEDERSARAAKQMLAEAAIPAWVLKTE